MIPASKGDHVVPDFQDARKLKDDVVELQVDSTPSKMVEEEEGEEDLETDSAPVKGNLEVDSVPFGKILYI